MVFKKFLNSMDPNEVRADEDEVTEADIEAPEPSELENKNPNEVQPQKTRSSRSYEPYTMD